jgi:ATP-binding cassette subfamily F protein uup
VSKLSGGEKARVVLARLMLKPADRLVLDEPTNDLDIPTLEVLEESLLEFPGALVLVTHDRYLIDRVSTQILALDGTGRAEYFADYSQWESSASALLPSGVGGRRADEGRGARAKRLSYLEQREFDAMEAIVLAAEEHLAEARRRAEDPSIATDADALQQRFAELREAETEVDRLYKRWSDLEAKMG